MGPTRRMVEARVAGSNSLSSSFLGTEPRGVLDIARALADEIDALREEVAGMTPVQGDAVARNWLEGD